MEPANDSDEEMELMCEVENLQLQLKKAGEPVDPMIAKQFAANIASATQTSERIRKWKRRVQQLKTLLHTLLAPSGPPAAPVLPVIGDTLQPPATYMAGGVKLEPASTVAQLEPRRKIPKMQEGWKYIINEDGSPPTM